MRIHRVPASRMDAPSEGRGRSGSRRPRPALRGRPPRDARGRGAALGRALLEAIRRRDADAMRSLFTSDAADRDDLEGLFERLAGGAGPVELDVHDVLGGSSHAAVLFDVHRTGSSAHGPRRVALCDLARGRIREVHVLETTGG